jgi:hypothetical protein
MTDDKRLEALLSSRAELEDILSEMQEAQETTLQGYAEARKELETEWSDEGMAEKARAISEEGFRICCKDGSKAGGAYAMQHILALRLTQEEKIETCEVLARNLEDLKGEFGRVGRELAVLNNQIEKLRRAL